MCYFKANIQHYFVNVSVQRRKAVCVGCVVYLDVLVIGCIVYLAELVMIGLGIRLRQGFAGEGLRVGYKPDDRIHPKIKQKKEPRRFLFKALSIKEGGYLLSRIALQYHRRKRA